MISVLTCSRIIVDLGRQCKVAVHLGTLPVDHHDVHAGALRLILGEFGLGVVGLELLNHLEFGLLCNRTHLAEEKELVICVVAVVLVSAGR